MAMKCDTMMIDKFGRLYDLEKLETIHPQVEEFTLRMLALQARIQREEDEAEERLRDARDVYVVELRENTRLTVKTLMLFNEMQTFSGVMNNNMRNLVIVWTFHDIFFTDLKLDLFETEYPSLELF